MAVTSEHCYGRGSGCCGSSRSAFSPKGVIPTGAVLQAEGGIWRGVDVRRVCLRRMNIRGGPHMW